MPDEKQFGLVIAYLLPGFIALLGLTPIFPIVSEWLRPVSTGELGLGPPVYTLLLATAIGIVISCVRWVIVDHVLAWTGIPKPAADYQVLADKIDAVDHLIDVHYRFYQFYANTFIAIGFLYLSHRVMRTLPLLGLGTDLGAFLICAVLLAGARDALRKYRMKIGQIVG